MLRVFYGDMPDAVYNTVVYFKNDYDPRWLDDSFVREMIRDVDKSEVLSAGAISSPVLGVIPPTGLSGGVKTLILIWEEPGRVFNASQCGDNCAKWLLEMGGRRDILVNLRHMMDFGTGAFEITVENSGEVAYDMDELLRLAGRYV